MKRHVLALVDCNNFYVSCEQVFHAALQNTPTIVLSNNDSCVVARSNEVKKLGVKMGQPVFEIEGLIRQHHIQVFSSTYSLYADMSERVMRVLAQFTPHLELYSIDEAWLDLTDRASDDLTDFGKTVQARVLQETGIPVSVGIASTKSLTKIANELVKTDPQYHGVLDLTACTPQQIDAFLAQVAIRDVWGIGAKYALFQAHFMAVVDALNRIYGRDTLIFAIQGITRSWRMRQLKLSSRFTTRWNEVLTVS
jgi:DNA polymerase V